MKMHVKKNHSETISCGMCNFEANQIETLDTHTFTCEMYKCNECKLTFLHLDKLRSHMKNEHYGCGCLLEVAGGTFDRQATVGKSQRLSVGCTNNFLE